MQSSSATYLKALIKAFSFFGVACALDFFFSGASGSYLLYTKVLFELLASLYLWREWLYREDKTKFDKSIFLVLAFSCFFLYDGFFILFYDVLGWKTFSYYVRTVYKINFLFANAFLCLFYFSSIESKSKWNFLSQPLSLIATAIVIYISYSVVAPIQATLNTGITNYINNFLIFICTRFLLVIALVSYLGSFDVFWTLLSGSILMSNLGDSAWNTDHFTGQNYAPFIYRSIWTFSILLTMQCIFSHKKNVSLPPRFDLNSISIFAKLASFTVSLVSLFLYRVLSQDEIWNIKSIVITIFSGILISGWIGQYTFDKLKEFSQSFLSLFSSNLESQIQSIETTDIQRIPSELSVLFDQSAQRILIEAKLKRDQFVQREIEKEQIRSAALLAHNLRSPLAALNGLISLSQSFPEDEKLLLTSAATRIKEIADGILNRYEKKEVQLLEIQTLLLQSIESKKVELINQDRIQLEFNSTIPSTSSQAWIHEGEFSQVVSNLLNNSIEAMKNSGGKIRVNLEHCEPNWIQISVSDSGPGIPEDVIPLLGKKPLSIGKTGGHGFGLSHAFQVIHEWKGDISIQNTQPQGTQIVIRLPFISESSMQN